MASPALAEDAVIYAGPAGWVAPKSINNIKASGPMVALYDVQIHMEDGVVSTYRDTAVRMSSPAILTEQGTISAEWMPDKGDLIIHRAELLRDGKVIDLIAEGAQFEVLRREQNLENRMVDGSRTATLVAPGVRVGDIMRVAYTVTSKDQALGAEMESTINLPAKPSPIDNGTVTVSWPRSENIRWASFHGPDDIRAVEDGDIAKVSIALPLPKQAEMPDFSPARYTFPPIVQATTFADWPKVSQAMDAVFAPKIGFDKDGPLARQVAEIARQTSDPLARMALATQLVQDKISYLSNGMNGGNYIPQSPDETWQLRYGDCKAKSVLLVSILRELGIAAEPFVVRSSAGDVLPELLSMPGAFDHIIAHAVVNDVDYWLDGTSIGTRRENIDVVPPFFYGLPLRSDGAELVSLASRLPDSPNIKMAVTYDSSAGVYVPALFDVELAVNGSTALNLRSASEHMDEDALRSSVMSMMSPIVGDHQVISTTIDYDDVTGFTHVKSRGIASTPWKRINENVEFTPVSTPISEFSFNVDRTRKAWKEIPFLIGSSDYRDYTVSLILPDQGNGFTLHGAEEIQATIAGVEFASDASLSKNRVSLRQTARFGVSEVAAQVIPGALRAHAALSSSLPRIEANPDALMPWDYVGEKRKLLAPLEKAYAELIAQSSEPEHQAAAYAKRAEFRSSVGELASAEADLDQAIAKGAIVDMYFDRAVLRKKRGDLSGVLADLRQFESLEGNGISLRWQVPVLGRMGKFDESLAAAREFADYAKTPSEAQALEGEALVWAGRKEEGFSLLRSAVESTPGNAELLFELCWQAGAWNVVDDSIIDACNKAIEKSNSSADTLNSRATAYYRLQRYADALRDQNAALAANPNLTPARFMRGVVRIKLGDKKAGDQDIANALRLDPDLKAQYAVYGIEPGK